MVKSKEKCPESFDECVYWTEKWCKIKLCDEK